MREDGIESSLRTCTVSPPLMRGAWVPSGRLTVNVRSAHSSGAISVDGVEVGVVCVSLSLSSVVGCSGSNCAAGSDSRC